MLDDKKFWDLYHEEVAKAAHEEQSFSHYEDALEDLRECENLYNEGLWC